MIVRLHHAQITIPNGEENRCRRFYCDLLGLREIAKPPSLQERGGFWLELDGVQVHVGTEENVNRKASKAHLAYEVDNLANWRAKLQEHGLKVLDGIAVPGYERFEFRDPFGNRVEFLEHIKDI
jgi:catechol 2,3-dioxygenase-like lactoylglutathione lyase family enzyme